MEKANEFISRLFEDDEFIKEFYRNGGINKNADKDEKNRLMTETANKMGYEVTQADIENASAEYFKDKGFFGAIKIFMHFNKIVKQAEKENNK